MIRINLLERPEAEIWRKPEKALWTFWFSQALAIFLWAKLQQIRNSRRLAFFSQVCPDLTTSRFMILFEAPSTR
jgi:hypothetical protein